MRRLRSDSGMPTVVSPPEQTALASEEAEVLYSEVERLPGPFRLPIVLCYFEGLTIEQAAHRLRCPAGTVRSRTGASMRQAAPATRSPRFRIGSGSYHVGTLITICLGLRLIGAMWNDNARRGQVCGWPDRHRTDVSHGADAGAGSAQILADPPAQVRRVGITATGSRRHRCDVTGAATGPSGRKAGPTNRREGG